MTRVPSSETIPVPAPKVPVPGTASWLAWTVVRMEAPRGPTGLQSLPHVGPARTG